MKQKPKDGFITKYFLTIIIVGTFLINSISMTDGFKENVGVHFALTLILGFMTLSIELFVNNKNLDPKQKAIKAGIPVVLFTLVIFAFSTVFLYS
ncbi:hypothetical protein GCM10007275_21930 [Jeotgalicoccus coquinae]|uniref:Membrane protein n=1 Tax=Jeotgalicoccus coquinae TaxID=709509 RepID=A0A6V7RQR5_9STAP|nr:hypothetical protein [Jeotgalicoccus coquinae]MBB6424103.1 putative membrane protein [Jeotgalicoccus coquinae]GGE26527.1 hypothetical protein GCM10007275_21930 [Jeotgalicoccus coquinae]CAD2081259.1 hypothetical protein JEOCOQ751_01894 [Jeotgalicoccus coquinae]